MLVDVDVLPTMTLADVARPIPSPSTGVSISRRDAANEVWLSAQPTNGVVFVQATLPVPASLSRDDRLLLPLYIDVSAAAYSCYCWC